MQVKEGLLWVINVLFLGNKMPNVLHNLTLILKIKRSQWIANRLITSNQQLSECTAFASRHNRSGIETQYKSTSYLYFYVQLCICICPSVQLYFHNMSGNAHNDKMNLTIPLPFDLNWPWKVMILMTYICAKIDKLCRWGRWCRWCADDVDISKVIDRDWFWILMSPGNCDTVIKGHQLSFHLD